ncbi:MAG: hypothetical protein ABH810_00065 [bacterium]
MSKNKTLWIVILSIMLLVFLALFLIGIYSFDNFGIYTVRII